jgi:hypothetical protein
MKRLFILIFCFFISFNLFSEEFSLFPWFCNQQDIYNSCIAKGWEYSSNTGSNVPSFDFKPTKDITYHNLPIYDINFMFNESGKVVSQTISFDNLIEVVIVFASVLDHAITDKARLINRSIKEGEYTNITINGKLNDGTDVDYVIYGQGNLYQITISYHIY